jgi:phosphatidylserine decarboxylase
VMKFGSRIDLYLPPDSIVRVAVGDKVQSGVTVLATLPPARPIS